MAREQPAPVPGAQPQETKYCVLTPKWIGSSGFYTWGVMLKHPEHSTPIEVAGLGHFAGPRAREVAQAIDDHIDRWVKHDG